MRSERGGPEQEESPHGPAQSPSSFRAIVEALRSIPERLRRPESLLMMLALMASLGMHMPPWLGLGALADYFEAKEREKKESAPEPVSFEVTTDPLPEPPTPDPKDAPKPPEPERPKKPEPAKKEAQKKPEPEKKKPVVEVVQKPAAPLPEPPKEERKQSITQKSDDPDVEPPPDAKYLAEESRRVEEESVASVTSETKNDPDPRAAAPQAADEPEKSGDSRESERGAEKGARDEQQQQAASRQRSAEPASPRPPSRQEPTAPTPGKPGQPSPAPRAAAPEQVVRDPLGSFVLAPSSEPAPANEGTGGAARAGARKNLKVSWRAFEDTFGAEQLAQDRLPREAKRLGAGREKRWGEFRAAIENYVVGVKPGNTTALNAAADPFAAYLAAFHRNLHMEFAHDFLAGLPLAGDLGNPALVTKVEIVVNADGSLDRVGVVKSSGNLMYDFGAFNAVQRGAPYPPTPEKIRSPDGRVYLRWALHRNESQCGTWNAEPFILKNPPRSPSDPRPDNVSPYRNNSGETEGRDEPRRAPGKQAPVKPGETLGLHDPRVQPARAS